MSAYRERDQRGCIVDENGDLVRLVAPWLLYDDEGREEAVKAYDKRHGAKEGAMAGETVKDGAAMIAAERVRQVAQEGWTPDHDDHHESGELARAGAAYALVACGFAESGSQVLDEVWPWEQEWWKPGRRPYYGAEQMRNLVKAGALIAAEIDRLQRLKPTAPGEVAAGVEVDG